MKDKNQKQGTDPHAYPESALTAETRERCRLNQPDYEPEPDYSGAFDGFTVTSDADPGL